MRDTTLRIKNLAIALEALSRINNEGSPNLYDQIESCLRDELTNHLKETYPLYQASRADDEIPF